MRKVVILCLCFFWVSFAIAQSAAPYPATDDEFVGPFSSWLNVKNFGAKGDGVTDATAAIQAAINAIGNSNSTASVVYIPAGTYLIKGTLKVNYKTNVSIMGENPATTIIKWGGAKNGTMLYVDGTAYSRFDRITWNGNKSAANAVDQSWDGKGYFDTGNEYAEDIFTDVGIGIRGGFLNQGFAETNIIRCKFIRNTSAGVSLGNFNALDIWVWYSVFQDCYVGVTNTAGAGNFKVYGCIFRNSSLSDITIGNTGEFSFRDNTSTNSNAFLLAQFSGNPATISIQGNLIIDPIGGRSPIELRNQGPVTFMDNIIRSRTGFPYPVVWFNTAPNGDLVAINNTYTVANHIDAPNIRTVIYDNPTVSQSSLSNLKEPSIPGPRPNLKRQVFEVPVNANAATIQSVINKANAQKGSRPVVHFPFGSYFITSTITLPAGTDIQLVGDGNGNVRPTWLKWSGTGAGPVLSIAGPTKATIRDLAVDGGNIAVGIQITNVDQKGARVFMQQAEVHNNQTNLSVNGLDHTLVVAHSSGFSNGSVNSIEVIGGSLAQAGTPQEGRTIIYAGAESDNTISHQVTKGGNLLIRDMWYESGSSGQYLVLPGSGIFTAEGCHATSPQSMSVPQLLLNNFNGRAVITTTNLSNDVVVKGNGSKTSFLSIANLSDRSSYLTNTTSPAGDVRSLNVRARSSSGSSPLNNVGTTASNTYITTMFGPIRTVHADILTALPANITNLRLFKVWVTHGTKGIELKNSSIASSSSIENKSISSVVKSFRLQGTTFNVFPNPVIDEATVFIQATESTTIHFKLFDSKGALVKNFETSIHAGPNEIKVNIKGLARGSYILQAAWSGEIASNKLIKE
jgi:hypothetical protein